jgi:hypothetical protein
MDLFLGPTTLSDTLTVSGITFATFPGYVEKTPIAMVPSGGSMATVATISGPTETWTCTGGGSPQTIQGWLLQAFDSTSGLTDLVAIALLPGGPRVVSQAGDSIVAQCTLTLQRAPGQP